ncbi:MAG: peroxiredoxin [Candidatus Coatesbacteria bacterium]
MKRKDPLEGRRAPAFGLRDQRGRRVTLATLRGRPVVLYFYPRDFTPGCALEAEDFRDHYRRIRATGAEVLGVSPDTVASHRRFARAKRVPFPLLSDPARRVCRRYRVLVVRKLYGRAFPGVDRSTFVIDAKGIIRKVFRSVVVKGHVDAVRRALISLKEV